MSSACTTDETIANEIIAAAEKLRSDGVSASVAVHGWTLGLQQRKCSGKSTCRADFNFQFGAHGRKLHTIGALKQALFALDDSGISPPVPNDGPSLRRRASSSISVLQQTPGFGRSVIGRRCSVLWAGCSPPTWFVGTVREFSSPLHLVVYDDGDLKWHNLAAETVAGQLEWLHTAPSHGVEASDRVQMGSRPQKSKLSAPRPAAAAATLLRCEASHGSVIGPTAGAAGEAVIGPTAGAAGEAVVGPTAGAAGEAVVGPSAAVETPSATPILASTAACCEVVSCSHVVMAAPPPMGVLQLSPCDVQINGCLPETRPSTIYATVAIQPLAASPPLNAATAGTAAPSLEAASDAAPSLDGAGTAAPPMEAAPPPPVPAPPPPSSWECPGLDEEVEVEVAPDESDPNATLWVGARVVAVDPRRGAPAFEALITLPDGSDRWVDTFTWMEEGRDWRRRRVAAEASAGDAASGDAVHEGASPSMQTHQQPLHPNVPSHGSATGAVAVAALTTAMNAGGKAPMKRGRTWDADFVRNGAVAVDKGRSDRHALCDRTLLRRASQSSHLPRAHSPPHCLPELTPAARPLAAPLPPRAHTCRAPTRRPLPPRAHTCRAPTRRPLPWDRPCSASHLPWQGARRAG